MKTIESRALGGAVELRSRPGKLPIVAGYAALFNSRSEPIVWLKKVFVEIVRPGAFLRSLMEVAAGKADVLARFEHSQLVGRSSNGTLRLREDNRGLHYEIEPSDTAAGRDMVELVRRGDVNAASFSFNCRRDAWRREGETLVRELHDVKLIDVSPVPAPAYEGTSARIWSPGELGRWQMKLDLAERQ